MNTESISQILEILPSKNCEVLYTNLPGGQNQWELNMNNEINPLKYYEDVYAQKNVGSTTPFRFGSYQIFKYDPDLNIYQFATLMNLTSPVVAAYYP